MQRRRIPSTPSEGQSATMTLPLNPRAVSMAANVNRAARALPISRAPPRGSAPRWLITQPWHERAANISSSSSCPRTAAIAVACLPFCLTRERARALSLSPDSKTSLSPSQTLCACMCVCFVRLVGKHISHQERERRFARVPVLIR